MKAYPQDPSLWTLQGLALAGMGKPQESLDSFNHALAIDAWFVPALRGALQTAYNQRRPEASDYAQRLLAIEPADGVANGMAGALAYQNRDCGNALQYFQRSEKEIGGNELASAEFADCLIQRGETARAVAVLEKPARMHPESVRANYNLAVAQMKSHDAAAAIKTLEPFVTARDPELLNLLASAYVQIDRPDDAFQSLESAIVLAPLDRTNYLDLAILCLDHHQENRAATAASAGIARIPDAAALFLIRGVAYAELAEYDKAETDFSTAARIEPDKPHGTIAMSLLYSDRNQLQNEKALLEQQLAKTPNDAVANYLLADLLVRSGATPGQPDFAAAKAHLERSLATKPDSAEAQVLAGKLCEEMDEPEEALRHFRSALDVEPENRSALDREFLLLRKLHRREEASQVSERLKDLINQGLARDNRGLRAASHD
jgi:tetratricopeptide (TPR) repeat protein